MTLRAPSDVPLFLLLGLIAVAVLFGQKRRNSARLPLPPGPKRLPIIGNLLDIPTDSMPTTFRKLSEQYGK